MKRFLLLTFAILGTVAFAFDVDTAMERISEAANEISDVSLMINGRLYDEDGTTIVVELDVMLMPQDELVNFFIFQPDALADNMIIFDGDTLASYTFLTHQVTLFDSSDPRAFGDIVPAAKDSDTPLSISLDLSTIFPDFDVKLVDGSDEEAFVTVVFSTLDPENQIREAWATISTDTWLPTNISLYGVNDFLYAELSLTDVSTNQGLTAEQLRELPFDAEIIDRRAKQ